MGNPLPVNLSQECRKAQKILTEFVDPANGGLDRIIPLSVLKKAQGFAFFSVFRLGFLVSARAGSGVVIARLPDNSWSSPSALGIGGVGGGFNAGVDVTDFLIVLNNKQAVKSFMATGSLQLGGNLSVAVGPLGRAAEASGALSSSGNVAAMFSYSKSKGLYGGVSVEGTILVDRSDANSKAYNRQVTAKQLLSGSVEPPPFAQPLISTIEKFTLTGDVARGIDAGRREEEDRENDGYSFDDEYNTTDGAAGFGSGRSSTYNRKRGDSTGMDSLDREMQGASISPSSGNSRKKGFVDDYASQRPGDYAFGSVSGGSHTNSPTRTRKSFLGGTSYSTANGTDYNYDDTGTKSVFDSTGNSGSGSNNASKSRIPFLRSRSSSQNTGNIFGDEAAVDYADMRFDNKRNASSSSNSNRTPAGFATHFERGSSSEDSYDGGTAASQARQGLSNSGGDRNDLNSKKMSMYDIPDSGLSRDSWEEQESLRRAPHATFTRAGNNDLLDFELDRSVVTQRQAPRGNTQERDLIDFQRQQESPNNNNWRKPATTTTTSSSSGNRKGYDSLDRELQQTRNSMSSNDSFVDHTDSSAWRNDFRQQQENPTSRPKMHSRTSSTQKIMNRLRGNSQSSKNALANTGGGETWDQRYRTPSPVAARSGGTPTGFRSNSNSTPTGFRSGGTPTGFRSGGTPTGFRNSSTTPTGFRSSSNSASNNNNPSSTSAASTSPTQSFLLSKTIEETSMKVIAEYDFQGQEIDDLSFQRGDVIDVLKRTANRDDWWLGKRGSKTGNFPANYTQDV